MMKSNASINFGQDLTPSLPGCGKEETGVREKSNVVETLGFGLRKSQRCLPVPLVNWPVGSVFEWGLGVGEGGSVCHYVVLPP